MKYKIKLLMICILAMFSLISCIPQFNIGIGNDMSETENIVKKSKENGSIKKDSKSRGNKKVKEKREKHSNLKPHILIKTVGESLYDDYGNTLYKIEYKYIQLKEDKKEYEPLIKAFEEYNKEIDEQFADTRETFEGLAKEEKLNRLEGYDEKILKEETDSYIMRADKDVVSILNYKKYDYGASEKYSRSSVSFDTSTGNRLNFLDVVKDDKTFFELVDKRIYEDYEEINIQNPSEYVYSLRDSDYENLVWTISPVGVTVYFDTRVLGSDTDGAQVVTISFENNENIFEPKYIYKENDYVVPIVVGNMTLHVDIDGDGTSEPVYVDRVYEQNTETLHIFDIGVKIFAGLQNREVSGYFGKSYLIKKKDKYYMYLFIEDELKNLYIYDLEDLNSDNYDWSNLSAENIDFDWDIEGNIEKNEQIDESFTDIDSFSGESMCDILYLIQVVKEWFVGEDGKLQSDEIRGRVSTGPVIRTLTDIKCSVVDENGKVKKNTATIPEGTYIYPVYSDDKRDMYIDVKILDKSGVSSYTIGEGYGRYFELKNKEVLDYNEDCYRITFDVDEEYGSVSIDGKGLSEIFEGIIY